MATPLDIDAILREYPSQFESRPYYLEDGDCVHWYFENEDSYDDRIDCWLTVYRAFSDRRLVGFKVKNVRSLLSAFDALGLSSQVALDGWHINLKALIAYRPWVAPDFATVTSPHSETAMAKNQKRKPGRKPAGKRKEWSQVKLSVEPELYVLFESLVEAMGTSKAEHFRQTVFNTARRLIEQAIARGIVTREELNQAFRASAEKEPFRGMYDAHRTLLDLVHQRDPWIVSRMVMENVQKAGGKIAGVFGDDYKTRVSVAASG